MRCRDKVESLPVQPGTPHGQDHGAVGTGLYLHGPYTLGPAAGPAGITAEIWGFAVKSTPGFLLFFCKELESSSRPLDHSDLCYGDGETEAGRCRDLPYVHKDQESRVHTLPALPATQLVIRGVTPRSPTSFWG